jgi:glutamate dehydrogenase/leucine dehydrogenase
VFAAIEHLCARWLPGAAGLAGRHVAVQGVGSVGGALVQRLLGSGAFVTVADLNAAALDELEQRCAALGSSDRLSRVPSDQIFDVPCDVFSPCALGGGLGARVIERLRCRAVAGAANNALAAPEDAQRLLDRGILYAPDFLVNVGGAMAITGIEAAAWSPRRAEEAVVRAIVENLCAVLEKSKETGKTTDALARELARARLDAAQSE